MSRAAERLYAAILATVTDGVPRRDEWRYDKGRATDHVLVRSLAILVALAQTPDGLTIAELIEHTGHSRSSVYRDLGALRRVGIPLESVGPAGDVVRWKIAEQATPGRRRR